MDRGFGPIRARSATDEWLGTARCLQQTASRVEAHVESMLQRLESRNEDSVKQILIDKFMAEKERRSLYEPIFAELDLMRTRLRQIDDLLDSSDPNDFHERRRAQQHIDQLNADLIKVKTQRALEYDVMKSQYKQLEQSIMGLMQKHDVGRNEDDLATPRSLDVQLPGRTPKHEGEHRIPPDPEAEKKNQILAQIKHVEKAIELDGGQYGGWDEHDHRHFLKIWNSLEKADEICERGVAEIYGQTVQSVMEHCKWFDRYNDYIARKKDLIAQWRSIKDAEKRKKIEETASSLSKLNTEANAESTRREQQEKETAIRKWKEERAAQEQEKSIHDIQNRVKAEKAERLRLQRRAKLLHEKLQKFREQNPAKASKENDHTTIKKNCIDEHVIDKIRLRNTSLLNKRKLLLDSKRTEHERSTARSVALAAKYRNAIRIGADPSRLLQATESSKVRTQACEAQKSAPQTRQSPFILAAPHRAVPQWRKGV